ncbi:Putative PAP-specific phosphatase, mitochondrial [Frankliniella fusca]|uniref:PAP-specific phosphatase, mitochondrial n=1 Tax=Frankliniella fusca TaxID=407009 RepID=A0AAE1H8A8_9NEOP|nr:Putative PAP-specific phosphatase, mitochondrial [Frankliniella fusca]
MHICLNDACYLFNKDNFCFVEVLHKWISLLCSFIDSFFDCFRYACCLLMRSIVLSCGSTLPLYTLAYSSFSQEKLCGGESKGLFSTLSLQVSFS